MFPLNLFTIPARILIGLWAGIVLCGVCSAQTQSRGVQRSWGKSIGKAQNDRDFLIYDADCIPYYWDYLPMIYIVGKAESGTGFELKQGENTYFHAKDDYTDAFISCLSPEGELLWSTYLPALEEGYYNAFATIVRVIGIGFENRLLVMVNSYVIQGSIEKTKSLIPACQGKLNCYVFNLDGKLLLSKSFTSKPYSSFSPNPDYLPLLHKVSKSIEDIDGTSFYFSGITYFNTYNDATFVHSMASSVWLDLNDDFFNHDVKWFFQPDYTTDYNASAHASIFPILQTIPQTFPFGCYNAFSLLRTPSTREKAWKCTREPGGLLTEDKFSEEILYSPGEKGYASPIFRERWKSVTQENLQYYADPINTYIHWEDKDGWGLGGDSIHKYSIFPGTVQNIEQFNRIYLVQGIHCHNYNNGFFKKDGASYAYSHDTLHKIPRLSGFYQERNKAYATVPYLLMYEIDDFANGQNNHHYKTPLWGTYLNADWMYEDFFHITDSAQRKDIYQPYEPVLLSSGGDTFFFVGNAKSIGKDLIDNLPETEEMLHHQGIVLAFSITDCPPETTTTFQSVRYLCPDGSVELKVPTRYTGFKFRFDPAYLADSSIVLNDDSTRAWAKKAGSFAATLDGSAIGCPDVTVAPIRISMSPHPEPVSALNPDSTIAACAAAGVELQAVTETHRTFSFRWFDGETVNPKTVRFNGDSLFFASVEVSGYCTSFRDSTQIRFLPPYVDLGKDSLLCTDQTFADTSLLLHLSASQDYFSDADWIFRWKINGADASDSAFQPLRYADLQEKGIDYRTAVVTVAVTLSDADVDGCTAFDTLAFSLASLPTPTPNRFLPQSKILCAHQEDLALILPDTAQNYRCFWLDQNNVLLPYGYDTNRFTIAGMHGTDGFGANTDTRSPRFFQLRLDHRFCGISYFDTLLIYDQVKPAFELAFHDTVICLNEPVVLDSLNPFVYRPFYTFEWNDGTQGSGYTFTDAGLYTLRFSVNEDFAICGYDTASDTVRVLWSDPALTLITLEDTSFCEKLSVTLDATVPYPSTRYSWQEGDLDDLFSPLDDTTLFISPILEVDKEVSLALFVVDTLNCGNTKQIAVTEEDCKPNLSIPNVFTPNGDGVNDVLKFRQIDYCYDVDILIVDRKGSHVLHQKLKNPDDFAWNGCMNNGSRKLPDGAYFYFISYKNIYGKKKYQSGSITILGSRE